MSMLIANAQPCLLASSSAAPPCSLLQDILEFEPLNPRSFNLFLLIPGIPAACPLSLLPRSSSHSRLSLVVSGRWNSGQTPDQAFASCHIGPLQQSLTLTSMSRLIQGHLWAVRALKAGWGNLSSLARKQGQDLPYNFRPTEMPWWRASTATSEMLQEIAARYQPKVPQLVSQMSLFMFVDTSGQICRNCSISPGLSNRELLEMNLKHVSELKTAETLQLLDAISYAEENMSAGGITVEQVIEIHNRVLGWSHGRSRPVFRDENSEASLRDYLQEINSCIASLQQHLHPLRTRIPAMFNIAAHFLASFQKLHPFVDGNARVGEVVVAVLLKEITPFPFRVHSVPGEVSIYTQRLVSVRLKQGTPSDLAAYMIEKAWLEWQSVPDKDFTQKIKGALLGALKRFV